MMMRGGNFPIVPGVQRAKGAELPYWVPNWAMKKEAN